MRLTRNSAPTSWRRPGRRFAVLGLAFVLYGCGQSAVSELEGRPTGPYRLTLAITPSAPQAAKLATLTYHLTDTASGQAIQDLQVLHERLIHTFIVARDFSSFAHIHHEDFAPVSAADIANGTLHFPYAFPRAGEYRIVSEFTRRDRSWIKQFDLTVGTILLPAAPAAYNLESNDGPFQGRLTPSPARVVAGYDAELVLSLANESQPVNDLELLLGAEVHVAIWRGDGDHFGHTHSYTPEMAAMSAHGGHSAAMMIKMMSAPATLIYHGPQVPVRYTFPTAGTYHVFMQCAPGGIARVFHFALEVVEHSAGMDTTLQSIVPFE